MGQRLGGEAIDIVDVGCCSRVGVFESRKPVAQGADTGVDALRVSAVGFCDAGQHLGQSWAAVAGLGREVGATPEGLAVGRQEHGQGPAAMLAEQAQCGLVNAINIRVFLAVHLDGNEQSVHEGGDVFVFEALTRHDVAPVAGGIANREQDGLVLVAGARQRFRAPRHPVNRVVLVL